MIKIKSLSLSSISPITLTLRGTGRSRAKASQSKVRQCSSSSTSQQPIDIVFLRHGQSTWNQQNIFIGMTDTPLTPSGKEEARQAGELLKEHNVDINVVFTSLLRRSTETTWLSLQEMGMEWLPVHKDWRLNERNYGALVGRNKKQCVEEFGQAQVKLWRRSWDCPPPKMSKGSKYYPFKDPRYKALGIKEEDIPLSESLKDVTVRTSRFWDEVIEPLLKERGEKGEKEEQGGGSNKNKIMIVGHENNLRSIIKRLDGISDEDILSIEIPRAIPLVFRLDPQTLKPIRNLPGSAQGLSGRYLYDQAKLAKIADRDQRQVYDLSVKENLESSGKKKEEEKKKEKEKGKKGAPHPHPHPPTSKAASEYGSARPEEVFFRVPSYHSKHIVYK